MLTEAFSWLSRAANVKAIEVVAQAIDSQGMIGGQVADLEGGSTLPQLEFIHKNKTAKLITASVLLGGVLAAASEEQLDALRNYGESTGRNQPITDLNPPEEFNKYVQDGFYGHPFIMGNGVPRPEFADRRDITAIFAAVHRDADIRLVERHRSHVDLRSDDLATCVAVQGDGAPSAVGVGQSRNGSGPKTDGSVGSPASYFPFPFTSW